MILLLVSIVVFLTVAFIAVFPIPIAELLLLKHVGATGRDKRVGLLHRWLTHLSLAFLLFQLLLTIHLHALHHLFHRELARVFFDYFGSHWLLLHFWLVRHWHWHRHWNVTFRHGHD